MRTEQVSTSSSPGEIPSLPPIFGDRTPSARKAKDIGKKQVLTRMERIIGMLTLENFDLIVVQIESGITTPEILEAVVTMIFYKAVSQPMLCPMYAHLSAHLNGKLPQFYSEKDGEKIITFRRILLNKCQEAFEETDTLWSEIRKLIVSDQEIGHRDKERIVKLWSLGNIHLIGELWKKKLVSDKIVFCIMQELLKPDMNDCPTEANVEAICLLFNIIGEQLDENPMTCHLNDTYFNMLKNLTANLLLTSQLRFMVQNIIDLRANNWSIQREDDVQFKGAIRSLHGAIQSLHKALIVFETYKEGYRGRNHVSFNSSAFYFAAISTVLLCMVCLILGVFVGRRL